MADGYLTLLQRKGMRQRNKPSNLNTKGRTHTRGMGIVGNPKHESDVPTSEELIQKT
jgi:hypothetical protein